jgi:hypothetical protein
MDGHNTPSVPLTVTIIIAVNTDVLSEPREQQQLYEVIVLGVVMCVCAMYIKYVVCVHVV